MYSFIILNVLHCSLVLGGRFFAPRPSERARTEKNAKKNIVLLFSSLRGAFFDFTFENHM